MESACQELTQAEKYMFSKYLDTIVLWSFIIKLTFHYKINSIAVNEKQYCVKWAVEQKYSSALKQIDLRLRYENWNERFLVIFQIVFEEEGT